jgi:anti-anti-sigma factor
VPLLNVALVPAPDQVVVRLTGDADLSTVPLVTDALVQAAGLGTRQVVVDVAGARFWDCSGLHALTTFTADLAAAGRACRLVGATRQTRRLIAAADLSDRLHLDGPVAGGPAAIATATGNATVRRPATGHPVPPRDGQLPVAAEATAVRLPG